VRTELLLFLIAVAMRDTPVLRRQFCASPNLVTRLVWGMVGGWVSRAKGVAVGFLLAHLLESPSDLAKAPATSLPTPFSEKPSH
jgi:hypothetical protein